MKYIEKVELSVKITSKLMSERKYYFGKSLIEVMLSPNGMNVKHITHNCGLITSNRSIYYKMY